MKATVIIICLGIVIGCGRSTESELEVLKDQVMVVHDEVMPLMDPLYRIRRDLQKGINEDSTQVGSNDREKKIEMIREIQLAEDAMMNWMRNFNLTYQGETDSLTLQYFAEKMAAIEEVAYQMRSAQTKGKAMLAK